MAYHISSCYSEHFIILCNPTQNTSSSRSLSEVRAVALTFYSLLTPRWLYECQLSAALWHSPCSLAAAPLPPAETKQRASLLLLLLNDRNKSQQPLLSPVKGGKSWEMGKLTIPVVPAWLLTLTSSLNPYVCVWECLCSVWRWVMGHLSGTILNGASSPHQNQGVGFLVYICNYF